jgi:uncharacterized protein
MKLHRLAAVLIVFIFCSLSIANAQEAADAAPSKEQVLKMLELMRVRKQTEMIQKTITQQMQQQMQQMMEKETGSQSDAKVAKMRDYMEDVTKIYPISEMLDDMVPIYQKHMSKTDVDAIISFYSSPAGQRLLDSMPAMMQDTVSMVMTKMNTRMGTLMEKLKKDMGEPAGEILASPPPPPPPTQK